ncbi:hypothetical protein CLV30_12883 [Haloactinopolyspora alba]|uniref:Uncharacterized protein n=1 Tax=Haloactinopolyspora alba TaxID=648780 RepID=A0A2P8DF39_9ACTN|nr:hypothetical protein [Haloactinopolyspora alba]PSK95831.1 hypothetical protein CLV30_12883 [Haloactinopolyspora alba]
MSENTTTPLPAPLNVLDEGLNIDELDAATKGLGDVLTNAIGEHVQTVRSQRQALRDNPETAVYTVGEVAGLVRDLAHGADVLRRIAAEFTAAAKSAEEFIADEAMSTGGSNLAVPDGETEIVVGPKVKSETWAKVPELSRVVSVLLARDVDVDGILQGADGDVQQAVRDAYADGAAAGFVEVERYGKVAWRITDAQKLSATLMQRAEDALATDVENAMGTHKRETGDFEVKRQTFKAGRRR